jgi:PAS domain S-box-containing protein
LLAAANADLSNLFASTHIATLFLDRELRIARFTPAATALFHVVGSDVGRPIADLAPRFRGLDLVADARSVLETRELVERQIEANDSGAWFVVRARPYRTLARDVAGVVVTFVDISDIKRIERELRASEERFAVTFRSAPAPLAIADAETERILDVNAAWTTTFGFTREEALGRTSVELGIVRSPDERARMIELASRGPGAEVPEIPLFARGGRELYVVARSATIEQGGRPCTMSACIDVTGQRRAEEALRRSEQRLRVLIENVSAGVALIDSSGRFSVVNGRFLSLFDLPADADILNVNSQDWSAYEVCDERGQTLDVDEHPVRRAVLRREAVRDQLVSVRPPRGGEPTWMLVSAEPLFDAAGSLECIICTYTDLTERRRAEQAVREERAKLAAALASIPDAVFLCDVEGRFAELNDAFVRYYRFPDRAACPRRMSEYQDLFELTRPDGASVPPDESVVPRALRGETGMNAEYRLRRRDTGESWIGSYSYAPIRADDGVVTGAVIVARDVTQQKEAARALAESEATLRGILDAAKESIWLFGVDGTVLMGNETALSRWPRPASEILGRTPHDLMPPDLAQARAARLREAASGPVEFEDERGGVRFEHRFYPIREADGRVERIAGFSRDITRRWQQERRLEELSRLYLVLSKVNETIVRARDSAELFREVCRIIAEDGGRPLVWIGLLEGRVVVPVAWAGEAHAYVDTLHVEIDGALGEGPSGTAVREDRPVVDDDFDEDPSLLPWREEAARFRLRASASFPLRRGGVAIGSLTLYAHEPGTFGPEQTGLLEALGADISYALDMMAQAAALRESEQRLREADRRKNEFLAVLSHELRNPLAPIRNSLHILDRAPPGSERALRTKAIIDRQVGQLVRLVDDLLDVTRISNGKIQIQRAPMDLVGLLLRTAEDYRPEFGKAGVSLTTRVGERPVPVFADAPRLAQAVGNLLQNAAKFTPPGGHVTLSLDEEGGCAVVRVRDDGAGIKAAVLERLFQPFTQADETLDRSKGGLGLGLALVKGLMELHGGSVEAASDGLGRGAEFTLRLPLHGEATS